MAGDRDFVLSMTLDAPRANVWRCWTEPDLLKQWFAPAPWTTPEAEMDVRPGGASRIVMRSPEGQDMPCRGVYLEVAPKRSEEHTSELQSLMRLSYAAFCLKQKNHNIIHIPSSTHTLNKHNTTKQ